MKDERRHELIHEREKNRLETIERLSVRGRNGTRLNLIMKIIFFFFSRPWIELLSLAHPCYLDDDDEEDKNTYRSKTAVGCGMLEEKKNRFFSFAQYLIMLMKLYAPGRFRQEQEVAQEF
jgi:hypothetical protein